MTAASQDDAPVVIIGAGLAGLTVALHLADTVPVVVLAKRELNEAATAWAQGGIVGVLGSDDSIDSHVRDTQDAGAGLVDEGAARFIAERSAAAVGWLVDQGVPFTTDDTGPMGLHLTREGGHAVRRIAHAADATGKAIHDQLLAEARQHPNIRLLQRWMAVDLITSRHAQRDEPTRVYGVYALDIDTQRVEALAARAVVLATGGVGRAYRVTSNSWEGTGDGHALAYAAGAELIDMEFVQFHPTGMVWPPSVKGILVTEGVRGEGGVLRNSEGRRFMFDDIPENYRPQTAADEEEGWRYCQGDKAARRPPELLTRDHVARCIMREIRDGRGSPHGGVFLDISWIKERMSNAPEHIRRKLPSMYHQFKELAGIDITKEPMEVGPTTHYMMGGVRVDPESQMSTVPGLFAAGECAAGLHGANRLGGNSLSDLLVFGQRAGEHSAKFALANGRTPTDEAAGESALDEALAPFEGPSGGENPYRIQHELQATMQDLVGIVRRQEEMERAVSEVATLSRRARAVKVEGNRDYNPGWHTALDLRHLLTVSEAIARAALLRKESRGAHFRDDYPDKDKGWGGKNLAVRKTGSGEMEIREVPVPELRADLKAIIDEEAK